MSRHTSQRLFALLASQDSVGHIAAIRAVPGLGS